MRDKLFAAGKVGAIFLVSDTQMCMFSLPRLTSCITHRETGSRLWTRLKYSLRSSTELHCHRTQSFNLLNWTDKGLEGTPIIPIIPAQTTGRLYQPFSCCINTLKSKIRYTGKTRHTCNFSQFQRCLFVTPK